MSNSVEDAIHAQALAKTLIGNEYAVHEAVIRMEELEKYSSLDALLGPRYYKILFITRKEGIGHYVLLTDLGEGNVEYFDSAGNPPHPVFEEWAAGIGIKDIAFVTRPLQAEDSYNCGRFVLARISSQPSSLLEFLEVFNQSALTPDAIVRILFNVDNVF